MTPQTLLRWHRQHGSTEWRTYLALHAAVLSLADDQLRTELQATLADSERDFIARIATSYEQMTPLLGYRLRPELDTSFQTLASVLNATLRTQVIMALSTPEIATRRIQARPFGATQTAEWSQTSIALTSIAVTFLEPDPNITWNRERIDQTSRALEAWGMTDT